MSTPKRGVDLETFLLAWQGSTKTPDRKSAEEVLEAFKRWRLFEKTDSTAGGAIVLLNDAADSLKLAAMMLFEEGGTSPDVIRTVEDTVQATQDALLLAKIPGHGSCSTDRTAAARRHLQGCS